MWHSMMQLQCKFSFSKNDLTKELLHFYERHIQLTGKEALRICSEMRYQNKTKWRRARKVRITWSTCHAYFTYVLKHAFSWESQVSKIVVENFTGNNTTRYGKKCEQPAINKYTIITRIVVRKIGFILRPKVSRLGYIPGRTVFQEFKPCNFVEVKRTLLGKITTDGENFILNPRHTYFSQVQFGMSLLNLTVMHFVVYSEVELLILTVHKNYEHIGKLVQKLQFVYFKHLLPKHAKFLR